MAQYTWAFDAQAGVWKNSSLSKKMREASIADVVFFQFADTEPGFGKHKGETHNIFRWKNIAEPTSAVLNETTRIPIDTLQSSATAITIQELGRGVEFTSWAQDLSVFNPEKGAQKRLKAQMELVLDTMTAAAFKTAKVCAIPTSLTGITWDTDGTPSTPATVNLNGDHCGVIRDYMRASLHVPYYKKGYYMGIGSTKALRGIKSDPNFQTWNQYMKAGDVYYNSEVGMVEQIKWIESNHDNALSNAKGTGGVLGEAVIFGDDAVALIEAETPELRVALPADSGRFKSVVWVGELALGLAWDTANDGEAKVLRVTSS